MNLIDRQLHDRPTELAARAIDGWLTPDEAGELETHLAACPICVKRAAAMRADAYALSQPVMLLPSRRVDDAVHAAIARPPGRPRRYVLLAAAALLLLALLGAVAVGSYLQRISRELPISVLPTASPVAVVEPGPEASPSIAPPTQPTASAPPDVVAATLPIAAGDVQMAPGPDGGLYVSVNELICCDAGEGRTVLALLDADGQPRPGWPIELEGLTCANGDPTVPWPLTTMDDGSVVVVCNAEVPDAQAFETRAFSFDATGSAVAEWSVPGDGIYDHLPRVVDGELHVIRTDATSMWLTVVAADGTIRTGTPFDVPDGSSFGPFQIGPDGTAYRVNRMGQATEITAFDLDGARPGWPVRVEGITSPIAFGSDGRLYLNLGSPDLANPLFDKWTLSPTRTLVFDRDGQPIPVGSDPLPVGADSGWTGAADYDAPSPPLVAADGSAFIISGHASSYGESEPCCQTTIFRVGPGGAVVAGWPYEAELELQWQGRCTGLDTGCGVTRAWPTVGAGNVLYVLHGAVDPASGGGSIVAIGADGHVIEGWPVSLNRAGSEFRSVVVGTDGIAYVLAVEQEAGDRSSATILAIEPDSTVRSRTTVVQP